MIEAGITPSRVMAREAFENAITVLMALGGSTNAVVHLIAIAGLDDFDRISRRTPCIANVKPSGEYLMEDFFEAGGVGAVMSRIRKSLLAPDGAVLKQTAASGALLRHCGRAYVFETRDEIMAQIDRDDLPVDRDSVLVMRNCGPKGAPGFPEWGHIPMPKKLSQQGVTDMVRISDARMSGTSFGTVVLHVAPEPAVGGLLAVVETGDEIVLDVGARKLELAVPQDEIARRLEPFSAARAPLHLRLRAAVSRSHYPSPSRLRFRFSALLKPGAGFFHRGSGHIGGVNGGRSEPVIGIALILKGVFVKEPQGRGVNLHREALGQPDPAGDRFLFQHEPGSRPNLRYRSIQRDRLHYFRLHANPLIGRFVDPEFHVHSGQNLGFASPGHVAGPWLAFQNPHGLVAHLLLAEHNVIEGLGKLGQHGVIPVAILVIACHSFPALAGRLVAAPGDFFLKLLLFFLRARRGQRM